MDALLQQNLPGLKQMTTLIRSRSNVTVEGTSQPNDPDPTSRIEELFRMCDKVKLSSKQTSGFKDLITTFVEMLVAVM